ncbi:RHS repeat-associated core domain-containing protein [Streptomyces sp. NRRL S-237]|uniref:RHS repeat-associated core domain-containing protein n=1 Tax=Streptomyces sp. NRRL S-237 TaxID=1463895 RepID=UPI00068E0CE2|nr:RHS repeat-associated core domain-containing protein [Streptomyces sp. NRRL S-237]
MYFDGSVFMGETVTLSTGMENSDAKLGPDGKWLEVPHQVKVTWRVSCGKITTFDLNQVVSAPSGFYASERNAATPHVSMQVKITPQLCPETGLFAAEAIGTVIDVPAGDNTGVKPVVPQFASGISDGETYGCGADCGTTGFAQPQAHRNGTVNTATGAFSLAPSDLTQGMSAEGWAAARHYSSNNAASGAHGQGWSVPWETRLSKDTGTGNVTLTSDSGSKHKYTGHSDGTFTSPSTSRSTLKHLPIGGYTLTTLQQRVLSFDESGLLTSDKDRAGRGESYAYSGGKVSSITAANGVVTTLQYTGALVTKASGSDGRSVDYGYTSGRLTSVTGSGVTTEYGYDASSRLNSVQDGNGHFPVRNVYDTQGRVVTQTDAIGGVTRYSYAAGETDTTAPDGGIWTDLYSNNHLLAQLDPFGNRTEYTYDGDSNLTRTTDPLGNAWSSDYNAAGRLTKVTAPDRSQSSYTYDANGNLATNRDGRGNTQTYGYDSSRYLSSVRDALGNSSALTYTPAGQLKTVTTPLGKTQTFGYDANGNLNAITSPLGTKTTVSYNAAGLPLTVTDPRGNEAGANAASFTTTVTYDAAGRQASVKDPKGGVLLRAYDPVGNLKTVTDTLGRVTTYTYDAANRISSTTSPGGLTTSSTYDAAGRLMTRTDSQGGKTTYGYDKAGRITTMTTPRGNASGANPATFTWAYRYDTAGRRIAVIDPTGQMRTTSYDTRSRPESVTDPMGNTARTKYDQSGNIAEQTDARGNKTSAVYDKANQLLSLTDGNGNTLTFSYDADGNRISETSPLGFTTSYGYDAAGRLVSRVEPRGNATGADPTQFTWRTGYDQADNVISRTDPLGNKVTSTYDALNNLTEQTDPQNKKTSYVYDALSRAIQMTAPDGGITKMAFDSGGNLSTRTDANQRVTTYEYDKAGRRTKVTDPLNRVTQYGYDLDGNRTKITNARGQTVTSIYDGRNLLSSSTYSDGTPKVSYTYDNAGRPATITDGSGVRTIGYDQTGRPLTITAPGSTNPFKYTYRADGSVSSRTYPDGRATSYAYDADGRMTGQTQNGRTTAYGWDTAGNLISTTVPTTPAITETRTYDQAGRMASISEGAGTRQFVRDGSGRVTTETYKDATTTGLPKRYDYDAAGRLTRACSDTSLLLTCLPGTTGERYTFDKVGNRLSATTGATTTNNVFDAADQMTSSTTGTAVTDLTYDTDGNLTKDGAGTYSYDALGRAKTTTIGADTFTFVYDADGNRTTTKKNGAPIRSHQWDVNNSIPRIATDLSQPSGWLLGDYHYGPLGEPQAVDTGAASFYYLHDRQNSVTSVRDLSGVENYKYGYGTWGTFTGTAGGGTQQASVFGFTGTFKDQVSRGKIDLPARGYDPKAGRFTSPDPRPDTASPTNSSTYAYANNDPVNQSDPSGACPLCISAGIGAAFGAVVEGGIYSWQHRNGGFTGSGLAMAAGRGAVVGGIAGLLMPGTGSFAARSLGLTGGRALATSTAVNAAVGAGFSYAVNEVNCRPTDPWDLLLGAVGGGSSSLIGPAFSWIRSLAAPRAQVFALGSPNAFRSLRKGEGPGASLVRPGADESVEPWEHVMGHENSPWISVTTSAKTMFETYGSGSVTGWKGSGEYGYVSLDLSKTNSRIFDAAKNLTVPEHIRAVFGDELSDNATRHNELLVYLRLEAEAIVHYWPPGTTLEQVMKDIGRS